MGSFEDFKQGPTPDDLLKARNQLQLAAMDFFHETPEQWAEVAHGPVTDAEIAAHIFEKEPKILESYFLFQNNYEELEKIIKHFEDEIENHREHWH